MRALCCALISANGIPVGLLNKSNTTAWYKLTESYFVPGSRLAIKLAVPSAWSQFRNVLGIFALY